jgi:hypothetical protein
VIVGERGQDAILIGNVKLSGTVSRSFQQLPVRQGSYTVV